MGKQTTTVPCSLITFILTAIVLMLAVQNSKATTIVDTVVTKGLFDSDELIEITLRGNVRSIINERTGTSTAAPLSLIYANKDGKEVAIDILARTRGNFRRSKENCKQPPLMLEFPKEGAHSATLFKGQKKLKLVMPCINDDYIIREWLVYKIYNLLTPKSFRARLVKVKLEDEKAKKQATAFYGILLEEEKQMAARNNGIAVEVKLTPQQVQQSDFLTMTVFEYLIGNTDWSIQYLQNIKLIADHTNTVPVAVPYDFDHSGIVDAPYAHPAEALLLSSVRERRYRGYCFTDLHVFETIISRFNDIKNDLYALYTSCSLLDNKYKQVTIRYLDDFYETINNPKRWQKEFAYPCDKNGTGNVVIKGLNEN